MTNIVLLKVLQNFILCLLDQGTEEKGCDLSKKFSGAVEKNTLTLLNPFAIFDP